MAKNQIYVDITYLAHWQGRLTGIPRVIYEFVKYTKDEYVFCVWDPLLKEFYEVDSDKTLEEHGKGIFYKKVNSESIFRRDYSRINVFLGKSFNKVSNVLLKKSFSRLSRYFFKHASANRVQILPETQSKLIIPMGEWHDAQYIKAIEILARQEVRITQFCYDMLPLVAPQFSGHSTASMALYNQKIFPLACLIVAISEHTKKDIINWAKGLKLDIPQIKTFRLGEDFSVSGVPKKPKMLNSVKLENGFTLCVGTIEIRKNHQILYYTYKLAAKKGLDLPPVIIVGRRGWMTEQTYELLSKDPELKEKIILIHDASDQELEWLYQKCSYTIYPSFYEGWGLPVAESALRGVPCITTNVSSIPEVAGDLATYFNPFSPEELLEKMLYFSKKDNLQLAKAKVGKYKPTKWSETAIQLREYVKEI